MRPNCHFLTTPEHEQFWLAQEADPKETEMFHHAEFGRR
jgi:hypothetical protein